MESRETDNIQDLVEKATSLISYLQETVDELESAIRQLPDLSAKRFQLGKILDAIKSFENTQSPVLPELEKAREKLQSEIAREDIGKWAVEEIRERLSPINDMLVSRTSTTNRPRVDRSSTVGRLPAGTKTQQSEFRPYIIDCLKANGGRAHVKLIRTWIEKKMSHKFCQRDLERLENGQGEVVWWNSAMWARFDMVREGLLKSDSPRGIWELSE